VKFLICINQKIRGALQPSPWCREVPPKCLQYRPYMKNSPISNQQHNFVFFELWPPSIPQTSSPFIDQRGGNFISLIRGWTLFNEGWCYLEKRDANSSWEGYSLNSHLLEAFSWEILHELCFENVLFIFFFLEFT